MENTKNTLSPKKIRTSVEAMYSEKKRLQDWMEIEKILTECQLEMGIIPEKAAKEIASKCDVEKIDLDRYHQMYEESRHPLVPLLSLYKEITGEAGEYLHLGASTNDVVDLAKMVTLKRLWTITKDVLRDIYKDVLEMVKKHAGTVMVGRTHNIHAIPITFGFKAAVWADEIHRSLDRLDEAEERIFVGSFSGACGTMASFEGRGRELEEKISEKLGLGVPYISWHAARDRFAEAACVFAIIGATLGKIAQEVYLLMGTETRELSEGYRDGLVGSSTMPHKINPINAQHIMGDARTLRYAAAQCIDCMSIDHEHNLVHFNDERTALEQIGLTMADLLSRSKELISNLYVDTDRMRKNLDVLNGAILSEHIMLELGKKIGKMSSKAIITELAVKAVREERSLRSILEADERTKDQFTAEELDALFDVDQYAASAKEEAEQYIRTVGEEK